MRPVRSELIKLLGSRAVWVVMAFTIVILGVYAYQYTLNPDSGVMVAGLKDPALLSSMIVLVYAAVYCIPLSVVVGSLVVGREYSAGTMAPLVVIIGRQRLVWAKAAAVLVIQGMLALAVAIEGIIWGLAVGGTLRHLELHRLLVQIVIGIGVGFTVSVVAMTVASLSRSTATSVLLCLAVFLGITMFLSDNWLAARILPVFPWSDPMDYWFSNLSNVRDASGYSGTPAGLAAGVWIVAYPVFLLVIQAVVARYREYGAQS